MPCILQQPLFHWLVRSTQLFFQFFQKCADSAQRFFQVLGRVAVGYADEAFAAITECIAWHNGNLLTVEQLLGEIVGGQAACTDAGEAVECPSGSKQVSPSLLKPSTTRRRRIS